MKSLPLIISIALPVLYLGCANTDPVGTTSVVPPSQELATGITLMSRSGFSETPMTMPDPIPPVESTAATRGEWITTSDSSGTSVAFVTSGSPSSVEYSTHSVSTADRIYLSDGGAEALIISSKPGSPTDVQPPVSSGLLTAGEWNDHLHWTDFRSFIRQYPAYLCEWQLNLQQRVILKLVDADDNPVPGARIRVSTHDSLVFEGTSCGDGSVAFFPLNRRCEKPDHYTITVENAAFNFNETFTPVDDDDQTWVIKADRPVVTSSPTLDLVFTVDVTGSMGDELSYIQAELLDICSKIHSLGIEQLRIGFVFYRDRGDAFVTKVFPFSDNAESVINSISSMKAGGGGDTPESVNIALKHTMQNLEWRPDRNCIRLCFLVADAPPHYYQDEQYIYADALDEAVTKGIKLMPVAGSGINKSTEYLLRHMAVKTMGKYIFITNDSGIGGSHIDPDIGAHDVESLNEIMVRTIQEEVSIWQ